MIDCGQIIASKENAVLVVIDIQEKLYPHVENRKDMRKNVVKLIRFCRALGIPIILSEQYPKGLGPTIDELKEVLDKYEPESKTSFSCCGIPEFEEKLKASGRKLAIITGIETHVCVFQTTRDLLEKGYGVHVLADAVSSRSKTDKKIGLKRMMGLGAVISSTEMFMFEVLKEAGTPEFKKVAPLLKE